LNRAGAIGREVLAFKTGAGGFPCGLFAATFATTALPFVRAADFAIFGDVPFLFVNFATITLIQRLLPLQHGQRTARLSYNSSDCQCLGAQFSSSDRVMT
jgi:hypothetical protein